MRLVGPSLKRLAELLIRLTRSMKKFLMRLEVHFMAHVRSKGVAPT